MRSTFLVFGVGAAVALAPSTASAADPPPTCSDTKIWVRPDRDRAIELGCSWVYDARLVDAPAHAAVSDLRVEGGLVRWTQHTPAGAPATDTMTLELYGGGEQTRTHELAIAVVPLAQNTAPVCEPVDVVKRGSGAEPVEVSFHASCRDAEYDRLTMEGHGPGTFTFAPPTVAGGAPAVAPSWTYRTATFDGTEQATLTATDELGAVSAPAPINVRVGPGIDSPPRCYGWGPIHDGDLAAVVYGRPGKHRSFFVGCSDRDRDDMELRVGVPPRRGHVTVAREGDSFDGTERNIQWWLDYTPSESFAGTDEFILETSQVGGEKMRNRIEIRYRNPPENFAPECGSASDTGLLDAGRWGLSQYDMWSERWMEVCIDPDGDPLEFEVTRQPDPWRMFFRSEGRPGRVLENLYLERLNAWGDFEGAFTVTDGIEPVDYRFTFGFWRWEIPCCERQPAAQSGVPTTAPSTTAPLPVEQARAALKTKRVRLLRTLGGARVYAPAARTRVGRRISPLAVTCATTCTVRGRLKTAAAGRSLRSTAFRATARHGRAALLHRTLTTAERRLLRRAGGGKLAARLRVRETGAKARVATVRVGLRR